MGARAVEREVERGLPRVQYPRTGTPLVGFYSFQGEIAQRAAVGDYELRDAVERAGIFESGTIDYVDVWKILDALAQLEPFSGHLSTPGVFLRRMTGHFPPLPPRGERMEIEFDAPFGLIDERDVLGLDGCVVWREGTQFQINDVRVTVTNTGLSFRSPEVSVTVGMVAL